MQKWKLQDISLQNIWGAQFYYIDYFTLHC